MATASRIYLLRFFCDIIAPGSIHGSTLSDWGVIYHILRDMYKCVGGKWCMHSTFATLNKSFIFRSVENDVLYIKISQLN